jgi:hypothetical protein
LGAMQRARPGAPLWRMIAWLAKPAIFRSFPPLYSYDIYSESELIAVYNGHLGVLPA